MSITDPLLPFHNGWLTVINNKTNTADDDEPSDTIHDGSNNTTIWINTTNQQIPIKDKHTSNHPSIELVSTYTNLTHRQHITPHTTLNYSACIHGTPSIIQWYNKFMVTQQLTNSLQLYCGIQFHATPKYIIGSTYKWNQSLLLSSKCLITQSRIQLMESITYTYNNNNVITFDTTQDTSYSTQPTRSCISWAHIIPKLKSYINITANRHRSISQQIHLYCSRFIHKSYLNNTLHINNAYIDCSIQKFNNIHQSIHYYVSCGLGYGNTITNCIESGPFISNYGIGIQLSYQSIYGKLTVPIVLSQIFDQRTLLSICILYPAAIYTFTRFIYQPIYMYVQYHTRSNQLIDLMVQWNKLIEIADTYQSTMLNDANTQHSTAINDSTHNSLIIHQALYGYCSDITDLLINELDQSNLLYDVTVPLRYMIQSNQLRLYNTSKSSLPGFCSPQPTIDQFDRIDYTLGLYIKYEINSIVRYVFVDEQEPLLLP